MSNHEHDPERPSSTNAWVVGGAFVMIAAVWLILPNLDLGSRGQGSESAAMGALKAIGNAQVLFREGDKDGDGVLAYTGSLQQLGHAGPQGEQLIDSVLAAGTKQGYHFSVGTGEDPRFYFWAKACPVTPGVTGDRFFCTDMTGQIYFSTRDFPMSDVLDSDNLPPGVFVLGG